MNHNLFWSINIFQKEKKKRKGNVPTSLQLLLNPSQVEIFSQGVIQVWLELYTTSSGHSIEVPSHTSGESQIPKTVIQMNTTMWKGKW